jgi:hypothetical protein
MTEIKKDIITNKKEKKYTLVVSYITEENIDRCWLFFSNIVKVQGTCSNIVINYSFDKGNNTYKIGNEFSCYWIGISKIHYKCVESKNNYGIRKISWIINLDIGFSIRKTYIIYPITGSNMTLIKLNLELMGQSNEPMDFEETREYYYKLQLTIINKIIKIMDESNEYYFIHESFIANKNHVICWNNIINLQNLIDIANGKKGNKFISNDDPEKVGTFWKYVKEEKKYVIFFKVKTVSKPNKRNTWTYSLETFGAELRITPQEIQINVVKINQDITHISFLIKYKQKINKASCDYKKKKWNEIIKNIKIFINNEGA